MMYLQLFLSFLQIGALSFGGGYAAMPLIEAQIVTTHGWLTMTEFANLVTIAEMTPGPIAVNAATFVGTKIAGVPGALAATAGCILPASILVTLIAKLYLKCLKLNFFLQRVILTVVLHVVELFVVFLHAYLCSGDLSLLLGDSLLEVFYLVLDLLHTGGKTGNLVLKVLHLERQLSSEGSFLVDGRQCGLQLVKSLQLLFYCQICRIFFSHIAFTNKL